MPFLLAPFVLPQSQLISFEVPATRLENLAPLLSKAIGEPIVIGTPLLNDTLTISVRDVTKAELMKKIAQVANATWSKKESFLLFEQSSDQIRAEQAYAQTEKLRRVTTGIENAKKRVAKMISFDENEAKAIKREIDAIAQTKPRGGEGEYDEQYYGRINRLDARGPYSRFVKRLVTRLNPQMAMLVSKNNRRVVFSNNPTGQQQRLNIKLDDIWAQLVNEQAVWSDVTKGAPIRSSRDTEYISYGFSRLASTVSQANPRIPTIQIKFATDSLEQSLNAQISIFDDKGRQITSDYQSLDGEPEQDSEEAVKASEDARKKPKDKIVLSPEAEEYRKFMFERRGGKRGPIPKTLLEKLLNPEKFEANGQYQLENFRSFAGTKNLIVYNLGSYGDYMEQVDFLRNPYYRRVLEIEESEKWFTLNLKDRLATRTMMIDPKLIGPMIRLAVTRDCGTIEEQADFAAKMPDNESMGWMLQERINRVRPYDLPIYNDRAGLRLFAFADPKLKKLIFSGKSVPLDQFDARFQREMFKSVFWADWSNWNFDYSAFQKPDGSYNSEFNELQNQVWGGILQEPTNMCPDGLTGKMMVKGTESNSEVLLADPEANSSFQQVRQLDPNYLGQLLFQQKNPTKYPWANQPYDRFDKNSLRLVSQRSISLELTVRKGISKSFSLNEMHVADQKIYTLDTLPEGVKKKVEEGYKQAEENDKHYGSNPYGRGSGPPPPPL
ncbi:MAG: hypothetical protein WCK51_07875 [Armatimonadota bacterium]